MLVDGRDVPIGGRAFDVLLTLIERHDRLVTRDELVNLVWADTIVEPNNLAVQISALRKVLGPHFVKTIPGRGYRFGVAVDESRSAAPHGEPPTARRTNLSDASPLIGRDDDVLAVASLVDAHRVVTVVGAGGIGKSRLAQHVLQAHRDAYAHGVCWIELASVVDAASLPSVIAAGLGIALNGDASRTVLEAALAPLEILIGLDNAEHMLVEIARVVETLLACAPRLRFLVTSQARLRCPQEAVFRLDALAVPEPTVTAAQALRHGAIELFVRRAQAVDARFELDEAKTSAVIRLCERLDGLPLAIEFAAARAPLLGVEPLLESLDQRLRLLKGGQPSAPARQQTMRATLEWSHHLLGPIEQIVFRRLAVISGSASLELIQAIVADPDEGAPVAAGALDRWMVIDALSTLIDRSLLTMVHNPRDVDRPRYRLLETLRAYAAERLVAANEVDVIEARHARAVAAAMDRSLIDRWSGEVALSTWVDVVEADRDNARVALAWAFGHLDLTTVLPIASVLLTRFLPGADNDERAALADTLDGWLSDQPMATSQLHARTQLMRLWSDRDLQRGLREAARVRPFAEACGERFVCYLIEAELVRMLVQTRDLDAAAVALARVDALEDQAWPAVRLWVGAEARGAYRYVHGPRESLVDLVRREHQLAQLAGAAVYMGTSHLVNAHLAAGEFAAAAAYGWRLLDELRDSRDALGLLMVRVNLGAALIELDDLPGARSMFDAAWRTARLFGRHGECADYLALIAALDGRWLPAAALMGYADAVYARRGTERWPVEMEIRDRAARLTGAALGASELQRRVNEGTRVADIEIDAIAFGGR